MERKVFFNILAGLILFCACNLAFGSPAPQATFDDPMDGVQNDDEYDYGDDSAGSRSTVASLTSRPTPFFKENSLTVSTIVGKNATLGCNAQNLSDSNVILWYKGNNLLTTGKQVLNPEYAVDGTSFALTVINASEASQGEYFCEVVPQKIRQNTTLVVSEHPIEAIIPESSKSSQESLYFSAQWSLLASSVIGIFLFLRI